MAYVTCNPKYSVKVASMDADHQQLFLIINELHDAMKTGRGKDVLQDVLLKLLRYTQQHFAREEAALKVRAYPKLAEQIEQHRFFTDKVKEFADQHTAGSAGISVEMLEFLTQWLTRHIVGTDQQYSEFLSARGAA